MVSRPSVLTNILQTRFLLRFQSANDLSTMIPDFIQQLATVGALAPSADNSQPWILRWSGNAMEIAYVQRHETGNVFGASSHATLLSVGAVAENLQMALTANAVHAHWQCSTDIDEEQSYASVIIEDIPDSFTPPQGSLQRHTNRLAFRSDPLPPDLIEQFDNYREGSNRLSPMIDRSQKAALVRLVQICSEARFCNRKLHEWLIGSLRFTPQQIARGDGLDINSLGLPPGGRHFLDFISDWNRLSKLNRLGAYKLLARSEVTLLTAAPALLCVVGPADTRNVIDAGRLLARIWTNLNLQGIAVHPYYVVTDQINRLHNKTLAPGFDVKIAAAEQAMRNLLALQQNETLHMILRIGYPKTGNVIRSRRLPLASILLDTSSR